MGQHKKAFFRYGNIISLCLIILIGSSTAFAQPVVNAISCGTDEQMQIYFDQHPDAILECINLRSQANNFSTPVSSYRIPVVFHVFGTEYNNGTTVNQSIIQEALDKTNEDFQGLNFDYVTIDSPFHTIKEPLDITFELAQLDPNGNPTTGIIYYEEAGGMGNYSSPEVAQYAWDNFRYCNVYITRDLYNNGGFYNSGVAWYPDINMSNNNLARVTYNGSYLASNTDENFRSVLTHEFGHWLDLPHTFDNYICTPDTTLGDGVADTPSQSNNSAYTNCEVIYNCLNEEINNENFMDYTDCYKMYTKGQVDRMVNALHNSPARNTLWTAGNLLESGLTANLGSRIAISGSAFEERFYNDGIIESKIDISCINCSFTANLGNLVEGLHFSVSNLPDSLITRISLTSDTTATIFLDAVAVDHEAINSVNNFEIIFLDPMVIGGVAPLYKDRIDNIQINFMDVYTEYCNINISYQVYSYITNITFNESSNNSGYDVVANYIDNLEFPVLKNNTYPISITTFKENGGINDDLRIQGWFDWNSNFIYDNDELMISHNYSNSQTDIDGYYTYHTAVTIPENAMSGNTAFRILVHFVLNDSGDDACDLIDSGETEDYGLNVYDSTAIATINFGANHTTTNFSTPVYFTDQSINDPNDSITSWSWTFEGGTPSSSTDKNPVDIIFAEPGTYDVTLITNTGNNQTSTLTKANYITAELEYCYIQPYYGTYFNVNHIEFADIDHDPYLSNSYDYFNSVYSDVSTGETYPMTLVTERGNGSDKDVNRVNIWADWNFDSQFAEDELIVSEYVYFEDYDSNDEYTIIKDITVPVNAKVGAKVGLRVFAHLIDEDDGEIPCGFYHSGNTSDYGLTILQGTNTLVADAFPSKTEFPVTESITFDDRSSSDTTITSWQWTFNNGTPSSFNGEDPPEISYNTQGEYEYSLIVTDAVGNIDSFSSTIQANYELCDIEPIYTYWYSRITNFTLDTFSNSSGNSDYINYYRRFDLYANTCDEIPFSATINTDYTNGNDSVDFRIWIDFNYNAIIENDELVYSETFKVNAVVDENDDYTITGTITIDENAVEEKLMMRVLVNYSEGSDGDTACGIIDSGEAEDYGINISEGCAANCLKPVISNQSTLSLCEAIDFELISSAAPPGFNYKWYLDGVEIAGATDQNYFAGSPGNYVVVYTYGSDCESNTSNRVKIVSCEGEKCVFYRDLSDSITTSNIYPAQYNLTASVPNQNNGLVYFYAGDSIILETGFENEMSTDFTAAIQLCDPYVYVPLIDEDFNDCTQPSGWTSYGISATGTLGPCSIIYNESSMPTGTDAIGFSGCVALIDDDDPGSGDHETTCIETPAIDISTLLSPELSLNWDFEEYGGGSEALIEVWDGINWVNIFTIVKDNATSNDDLTETGYGSDCSGTLPNTGPLNDPDVFDLSCYSNTDFKIRFCYDDLGDWGYAFGIDNVKVD